MIAHEVAIPYAEALFQVAPSKEKMKDDLHEAAVAIEENASFRNFLHAPHISMEKKEHLLKIAFEKLVDPLLVKFLLFVLQKGRIFCITDISKVFKQLMMTKADVINAQLITAMPVDQNLKENIKEKLVKSYQKKIEIEEMVDKKLIGGFVLFIGNRMLDASIKNRLAKLKENLLSKGI